MKILKPGETNTRGFLVEYDSGFVASNLSYKGKTNSDLIKEHLQYLNEFKSGTNIGKDGSLPETIIVYAVLQKWGIEYKNGYIFR
jgi:hypothetical protein